MFGSRRDPPKPSKFEPLILLLLAVVIAAALTFGYFLVISLTERAGGPM